jgi:hypothetical protein
VTPSFAGGRGGELGYFSLCDEIPAETSTQPARGQPRAAARAIEAVAAASGPVVVHFDVDVIDSGDLPLANFPLGPAA